MESTAVVNRWTEHCNGLCNYELIQTLAYSRVARPWHKRLKACVPRGEAEKANPDIRHKRLKACVPRGGAEKANPDISLLQSSQTLTQEAESLCAEGRGREGCAQSESRKVQGVDNIPSELLENGDERITTVLTAICQKNWETKKCSKEWLVS